MGKKLIYITPTTKVTRVILEQGIAVAISAMNSAQLHDWEAGAMKTIDDGNIWLPL